MTRHDDHDRDRVRRGQGLVELAVAMPILMLILLGTLDLGRAYADYVDLKSAARDGAGYGQMAPSDTSGIQSRVLSAGVPSGTTVAVTCQGDCTTIDGSGKIVVTAASTFTPITAGFLSKFGLGSITLQATASMRVLS
jgi:Flp pilus assembly protein TadG